MKENETTELTLKMNGQEFSWKGSWDADIYDLLDAFYGLLVGATFNAKWIPEWMKEWVEEHLEEKNCGEDSISISDEGVTPPYEMLQAELYGPDGRLKEEDGVTGYYADGTPVEEYHDKKAEVRVREDMDT